MREPFQLGPWRVEPGLLQVSNGAHAVRLEPRTMSVLCHLASRPRVTVSREELLDAVWKTRFVVEETLTRCISQLRQAFEDDPRDPRYIQTVPKLGYRLLVEPAATPEPGALVQAAAETRDTAIVRAARRPLEWILWTLAAVLLGAGLLAVAYFGHQAITNPPAASAPRASVGAVRPRKAVPVIEKAVAILPFDAIGDAAGTTAFADGITEDVIQLLATVPGIRVPSRTSSFYFKEHKTDIATIGRELDVTYVLEGSVQRDGERLRITAQLIDAARDAHVWSEAYERDLVGLFDVQREIALAVAQKLDVSIDAGRMRTPAATSDMTAYQLYVEARTRLNRFDQSSVREGVGMLQTAVERDPGFAAAWSALAIALWVTPGVLDLTPQEVAASDEAARAAARRALELDPARSGAQFVLADSARVARRFSEAQSRYQVALAAAPGDSALHIGYANLLGDVGRSSEALEQRELTLRLDPLSSVAAFFLARGQAMAGNHEAARRYVKRSRELGHRGAALAHLDAYLHVRAGDLAAAREAWKQSPDGAERQAMLAVLDALEHADRRPQAVRAIASLPPWHPLPYRGRMFAALLLGEHELAWQAAVEGVELKLEPTDTWWLPEAAVLRSDPRFAALAEKINLVAYWHEYGWPDACSASRETLRCR